MGLSDEQSGLTFSIYAIASVILSPIMGRLVPIVGAKRIMLLGIFCEFFLHFVTQAPSFKLKFFSIQVTVFPTCFSV